MKIIKCLSKYIDEEICDAKKYAEKAIKVKHEYPEVADVFIKLSTEELKHMSILHTEIVKLIEMYRKLKGDPPADMMAIYEYLHEEAINKEKEVRILHEIYNIE